METSAPARSTAAFAVKVAKNDTVVPGYALTELGLNAMFRVSARATDADNVITAISTIRKRVFTSLRFIVFISFRRKIAKLSALLREFVVTKLPSFIGFHSVNAKSQNSKER